MRAGLAQLLDRAGDIEVVGAAADGAEAVVLADDHAPDVILMDLSMPVMDGIEATKRILEADPEVRVVVLTSFSDRERILGALDAGALGYLLKDAEPEELFRGIRAAAQGDAPLDPRAARELLTRARLRPPGHRAHGARAGGPGARRERHAEQADRACASGSARRRSRRT